MLYTSWNSVLETINFYLKYSVSQMYFFKVEISCGWNKTVVIKYLVLFFIDQLLFMKKELRLLYSQFINYHLQLSIL